MPARLLVCIDGSAYADTVCAMAGWVAKRLDAEIDLLHVLRRHSDYEAPASDHTGSIGLGARSGLLEELTKVDEARGRLDQQKGRLILEHGERVLKEAGVRNVNLFHRRGSLTDTVQELEASVDMIFIGKRGEHADMNSVFLGSNLEKTARAIHKPLFVIPSAIRPIAHFLIAYDGQESVRKAVDYLVRSPLLKGLDCHLLAVDTATVTIDMTGTEQRLRDAGFTLQVTHSRDVHADQAIAAHVNDHEIDLLVTGAYSHSRVRTLLLGSTTASLIKSCRIPLLLFR